jgi:hypothetical protein
MVGVVVLAAWLGYQAATDPAPYARALHELTFPAEWASPHADVEERSIFNGSRVTRFYLADADPQQTALVVQRVVTEAGFALDRSGRETCYRNGSDGPTTCTIPAIRDRIHLWIVVFDRGQRVSYSFRGGEPTAGATGLSVVRVQAGAGN